MEEFLQHVTRVYECLSNHVPSEIEKDLLAITASIGVPLIQHDGKPKKGPQNKRIIIHHEDEKAASLIPKEVFLAKASKVYHNPDCTDVKNLDGEKSNLEYGFKKESYLLALKRGRRPCKRCRHEVFPEELEPPTKQPKHMTVARKHLTK